MCCLEAVIVGSCVVYIFGLFFVVDVFSLYVLVVIYVFCCGGLFQ